MLTKTCPFDASRRAAFGGLSHALKLVNPTPHFACSIFSDISWIVPYVPQYCTYFLPFVVLISIPPVISSFAHLSHPTTHQPTTTIILWKLQSYLRRCPLACGRATNNPHSSEVAYNLRDTRLLLSIMAFIRHPLDTWKWACDDRKTQPRILRWKYITCYSILKGS